jgi:hypothetical protein
MKAKVKNAVDAVNEKLYRGELYDLKDHISMHGTLVFEDCGGDMFKVKFTDTDWWIFDEDDVETEADIDILIRDNIAIQHHESGELEIL